MARLLTSSHDCLWSVSCLIPLLWQLLSVSNLDLVVSCELAVDSLRIPVATNFTESFHGTDSRWSACFWTEICQTAGPLNDYRLRRGKDSFLGCGRLYLLICSNSAHDTMQSQIFNNDVFGNPKGFAFIYLFATDHRYCLQVYQLSASKYCYIVGRSLVRLYPDRILIIQCMVHFWVIKINHLHEYYWALWKKQAVSWRPTYKDVILTR